MSKILKGLNESAHNKYDNNRIGFSRGPRDDERHDLDVQKPAREEWALKINGKVWSKDGKTVTFTSKEKALKARQSLLAKRPELEVGLVTRNVSEAGTGLDIDRSIPGRTIARISGDIKHRTGSPSGKKLPDYHPDDDYDQWSGKVDPSIHDDEEDTFDTDYTGDEEGELKEISNEKLGQYKTAAAADAGKADKEGDYKRADKRFSGIVKATKKQFANDTKTVKEDINVVYKKAKSLLTQLDENTQQRVINALKKSVVKEFEGDVQAVDAPTTNKPPRQTFSIVLQGKPPKDFEARFVWAALQNVFPNDYPVGTEKAEWKVVEVSKKGSAIIKSGINNRDIAETLVAKLVKNKVPAPCLKIISSELDEGDEKPTEPFKNVYPRVNNPQILGTKNRAKSAYYPPSRPPIKKLDKPLPESLGDELTSKSLEALQQVKQQLEQQRMADLEQWEKDFKQNTVAKFTAREPNLRQRATSTPMVAMPGEKHSDLKARLVQLNKAIEKQGILDNLVQKLDKKGLLTPNIEAGVDTSMLVRDGARDNYVELNKKLDKALEYVKNRLLTNKAAYAKPKAIDEDQLDELKCWSGYHRVAGTKAGFPGSCAKNKTNEEQHSESCPHCGGEMVSEELMNEKKDACYYKVKSRYKVWPSAYASGALVKCRNKGAKNWGNISKNESSILEGIERADENLHQWFKEKWVRFGPDGKIRGDCARGDDSEGKPKCLPQSKAHSLGKKGRASAASRKRREDPNPERSGKAINVNTKKKSNENIDEDWKKKLGAAALTGAMALGAAGANARVTPGDDPNINRLTGKPNITQPAQTQTPAKAEAPKGFSKEYLQSVVNGTHPRPMISVEKAQELLKQGQGQ